VAVSVSHLQRVPRKRILLSRDPWIAPRLLRPWNCRLPIPNHHAQLAFQISNLKFVILDFLNMACHSLIQGFNIDLTR
jgi:hypothetical protein